MTVVTRHRCQGCKGCQAAPEIACDTREVIALVGSPNVGKSVVFGQLTGSYVTVSNYPGTTVEISRGSGRIGGGAAEICDTPGMYSLLPITEEERVARSILLADRPGAILHVIDAKNIERMLPFTLQLLEAELPVGLVLNLMDEAESVGLAIDEVALCAHLGIPVMPTVATEGRGIEALRQAVPGILHRVTGYSIAYGAVIETAIARLQAILPADLPIASRAVALLLLQDDAEVARLLVEQGIDAAQLNAIVAETRAQSANPPAYEIAMARARVAREALRDIVTHTAPVGRNLRESLSRWMMHPIAGLPILLVILYGFYQLVGVFGAQVAVDYLEEQFFGTYINPGVTHWVERLIPWPMLQDLFVHDYGIFTLGIRYAIAIILPIVTMFFIAFAILEDSGYLPRLAMLIDRVFKVIGLNGRAVIPMVLGFGCATMATVVTRTLETTRERVIATFLLSLTIPCSAQMGVILALLSGHPMALWVFMAVMLANFLVIGYLTAKLMPGECPVFYMEIPPLRWPKPKNVLVKTYTRVWWYLREILPMFVLASVLIWVGRVIGLFDLLLQAMAYPVRWIGLPTEAATAFLYGFFRRDYGAAGLYDLQQSGLLDGVTIVVAVVTMALFMPCVAQFAVMLKERGWKMTLGMAAFIFPYAFLIGYLLHTVLRGLRVVL